MYIFYGHGGSDNHGCEAIVRSSAGILKDEITLFSTDPKSDIRYGVDGVVSRLETDTDRGPERWSADWFLSRVETKLTGRINREIFGRRKAMICAARPGQVWLSIGGDNYCYPGTDSIAALNYNLKRRGAKLVLWGCSVEPELLKDPGTARDIASFDLITARESISYEALKAVNPNTVLVSDPAFTLERADLPLPEGWVEGNMVGINASPLILQSARDGGLVLEAYEKLIRTILDTTDCSVALIPHVVCRANDDREPLGKLYEAFRDTGRVILVEDHNCMEQKGYIARCRFFIGARTHSTIAAYSTCVPTLVLGYSVKSRGIARDIFGSEENYVIPVQGLKDADALAKGFCWLLEHEDQIKGHLQKMMPEYIEKAYIGAAEVRRLLK